jgi:hypothetical protein
VDIIGFEPIYMCLSHILSFQNLKNSFLFLPYLLSFGEAG